MNAGLSDVIGNDEPCEIHAIATLAARSERNGQLISQSR